MKAKAKTKKQTQAKNMSRADALLATWLSKPWAKQLVAPLLLLVVFGWWWVAQRVRFELQFKSA